MENAGISARPVNLTPQGPYRVPKFLVELEPRYRVFFGNLRDLLIPRHLPPLDLTSSPAEFWPDAIVDDRFPWRGVRDSVLSHMLVLCSIYALALYGFFGRRPQQIQNPFRNSIVYYSVDDYLPELNTGSKPAKVELKGQPAYAKQEIISVPPQPDNTRQTIVTPWPMRLNTAVKLPNIVAWDPTMPPVPMSATPGRQVRLPEQPQVVPPAPEPVTREGAIHMPADLMKITAVPPSVDPLVSPRSRLMTNGPVAVPPAAEPLSPGMRNLATAQPHVVPPSSEVSLSKRNLPNVSVPSVVEPTADLANLHRQPGALNIGSVQPQVNAPSLPIPEQRALGVGQSPVSSGQGGVAPGSHASAASTAAAPPAQAGSPPAITGGGSQKGGGQLIALGLDPADPKGPIEIPAGTRRGIFAASPAGTPGAPGTPDIHGGGAGTGGTSNTDGPGTGGGNRKAPEGVFVGRGSAVPIDGPVAATKPVPDPPHTTPSFKERLEAAARTPDIPRATSIPPANKNDREIAEKVFGPKRYYSLTLNMPNLSSSTGSWVIRFAELNQTRASQEVSGPVPIKKVDPAYPAELLRDKVEGTVILYAVIHADGTVGEIRVLESVDAGLDKSAMLALAKWQFRPGTKNGEPVDLEAVVQIPFRVRKPAF